jgi:hypothetical protein
MDTRYAPDRTMQVDIPGKAPRMATPLVMPDFADLHRLGAAQQAQALSGGGGLNSAPAEASKEPKRVPIYGIRAGTGSGDGRGGIPGWIPADASNPNAVIVGYRTGDYDQT